MKKAQVCGKLSRDDTDDDDDDKDPKAVVVWDEGSLAKPEEEGMA
jgi:hypothetical protein